MKLAVLSPHLDDAALSVGAAIAARADAGDDVVVLTLFSRVTNHARREHDRRALSILGARASHAELADAPLRGIPLAHGALCGREPEPALVDDVAAAVARMMSDERPDEVWAPLSCGAHVDHRAVARAALATESATLLLYEDRPYARAAGSVREAWVRLGATVVEDAAHDHDVDRAVHFLRAVGAAASPAPGGPTPARVALRHARYARVRVPLDHSARLRRNAALRAYASEVEALIGPAGEGGWPFDDDAEALWRREATA